MEQINRHRVGICISGRGSNAVALIQATQQPDYPGEVVVVISDQPSAPGLLAVHVLGVPTAAVLYERSTGKAVFEAALDECLCNAGVEVVCLAGFMRIMSDWFIDRWRGRLLNIHPALPGQFPGMNTHARALSAGVTVHGCMVHHVERVLDGGAVILAQEVAVYAEDTVETLAARVLVQEHLIYPKALRMVIQSLS